MNQMNIFLLIFVLIHSADASGYGTNGYPEDVSSDPTSGHFEYANTNNAQRQTGQQGGMTIGDFHKTLTARLSTANTSAKNNRATMLPSSPTAEYSHPTMAAATQQKLSYATAQNTREFHKTLTAGLTNNETKRMTKIMPSSPTTGVMSPYEFFGTVSSGGETAQFAQTSSFGRTGGGGTGHGRQPTLRTLSIGGTAAGGTQQNIPANTGTTGRGAELAMLTGIMSGQSSKATGGTTMTRLSTFVHGRATDGAAGGSGSPTLQSLTSETQSAGQPSTFSSGTQPHPAYIGTHSNIFGNTRRQAEVAMLADALSGLPQGRTQPANVGTASHPAVATGQRPSSMATQQQQTVVLPPSTMTHTSAAGPSTRTLTPRGGNDGHPPLRTLSSGTQPHPTYVRLRPNTFGTQSPNDSASHPTASRRPSPLPTQQQQTVVLPPSTMSHIPGPSTGTMTSHVRLTRPRTSRLSPLGSGSSTMTQQPPPTTQNQIAARTMMTSISTASHQPHMAATHLPIPTGRLSQQQRQHSSGHQQTLQPILNPSSAGTGEIGTSAAGFERPTSSNEMRRSVSAPHRHGPSIGTSLATAQRISAGLRSASTGSSSGNPPISSLSDSERIRQRTKNAFASGAPLLNAYHGNLNQYGAPQGKTKKLLQSLSNLQGDAYSVSEASAKILHYGNAAHQELLQYQGQLDREKSEGKLNEQQYDERLQTAKDAMKYLTKLREASAEYKTSRENRLANE